MLVRFVLVAEGRTDEGLVPHLEMLCLRAGASEAEGVFPDLGALPAPPGKRVREQVRAALELVGDVQLVFVHRDADSADPRRRREMIEEAVSELVPRAIAHVPVVPVRETEAWLLTDESAIRAVAGNPGGRTPLNLPRLASIESASDPKETLRVALEAACCLTGRRLRDFRKKFGHHRRVLLERLDVDGDVRSLAAWNRLVDDTTAAVRSLSA